MHMIVHYAKGQDIDRRILQFTERNSIHCINIVLVGNKQQIFQ